MLSSLAAIVTINVGAAPSVANQPSGGIVIPPTRQSRGPLNILVLGDSLASGYHASTRQKSFVGLLGSRLDVERPGSTVFNESQPGVAAAGMLAQLHRASSNPVDIVLVVVGANDIRKLTNPISFAIQERALLENVHAKYPAAPVLLATIPDVSARYFAIRPRNGAGGIAPLRAPLVILIAVDDTIIRKTAARFGATIVDLHALSVAKGADDPRFISPDGLHPSDVGHARIADFVWPTLAHAAGIDNEQ
ncbi:MAG: SGNH/GDSL hydrolase family protein [Candidatus Eremiobacteraeota bacterium]|nr:SGNH/GDSL hydrolase family protein [Candidatus Eremiobacteraeota bacterium]